MSVDLTTRYLGLELKNPLVAAASPLCGQLDTLRRMEDAGAAAVVLPSLFEEQIEHEQMEAHRFYQFGTKTFPDSPSYFPELTDYNAGPDRYLRHVSAAKSALAIPVVASLNGTSEGGWVQHARLIQQAGADALELNVYDVITDMDMTSDRVELRYLRLVASVRDAVSIPLAVKLSPYFTSLPNVARCLVASGADGLVLFNRFLQPDIDLEGPRVVPKLVLSTSEELRLPLRWIAILHPLVNASLAATSGVHTAEDVLKLLLAGADVTMLASSLYQHGAGHFRTLLDGVRSWMEVKGHGSIASIRGSMSHKTCPDPSAFERANYVRAIVSHTGELR